MAMHGGRMFAAGIGVAGGGSFAKLLDRFEVTIQNKYKRALVKFAVQMNDRLLARTPVWEGTVLRNWQWSVGSPARSRLAPEGGGIPPGPTNTMALGQEPRRAINESAQKEQFTRFLGMMVTLPMPGNIYLTNNAPNAVAAEYGTVPSAERSRTPNGGIVRMALIETLTAMGAR